MKPADERVHWSVKGRERGNTDGRGPSARQREGEGRRRRAWAAGLRPAAWAVARPREGKMECWAAGKEIRPAGRKAAGEFFFPFLFFCFFSKPFQNSLKSVWKYFDFAQNDTMQ